MSLSQSREIASKQSLGLSSDKILLHIVENFVSLNLEKSSRVLDVGCGTGELLNKINTLEYNNLNGCDYSDFEGTKNFDFFKQDCNNAFSEDVGTFDCILSSEVIEHIENPWFFLRQLKARLNTNGYLVLSTPNPESWLGIITLIFKGYFNAFGPKDYPAHITPVSRYEIGNMCNAIDLEILKTDYIPNGRVPGFAISWQQIFPFLKSKRFSDNYIIVAKKL